MIIPWLFDVLYSVHVHAVIIVATTFLIIVSNAVISEYLL